MMNLLETIKFGNSEYKYNHMEFVFKDAEGERHEYRLTSGIDDVNAVVNSTDKKLIRDIAKLEEIGLKHIGYIAYASLHVEVGIFHETEWELSNTLLPLEIDLNGKITNAEEVEADIKRMEKMREIW